MAKIVIGVSLTLFAIYLIIAYVGAVLLANGRREKNDEPPTQ